jgi:hypothetical protein
MTFAQWVEAVHGPPGWVSTGRSGARPQDMTFSGWAAVLPGATVRDLQELRREARQATSQMRDAEAASSFGERLEPPPLALLLQEMRERDEGWADESCQMPPPARDWPDGMKHPLPSEQSAAQVDAMVSCLPRSELEILPRYLDFGIGRALMVLKAGATADYMARDWIGRIWWDDADGRYGVVVRCSGVAVDVMYAPSLSELIDTVCGTYGWD